MKKTILIALGILILTAGVFTAEAQQQKKIAILPFTVNSSENINYIRDGIWDMLISRVTVGGKTDVLSKSSVLEAMDKNQKKDLSQADVSAIGKRLKADYVVWGSITKIGDSLSLDGKTARCGLEPVAGHPVRADPRDERGDSQDQRFLPEDPLPRHG